MSGMLVELLVKEYTAIEAFAELLDQEADAMTQGTFSKLSEISGRKSRLAEQISLLEGQREVQQKALGYAPGRSGIDTAAAGGSTELKLAWQHLLTAAGRARAHNHRNGVMIHHHLDFTRQSINFLTSGGQALYGPDGAHQSGNANGNSLALG
jgi:flagella synthesis protein FlgN